MVGVSAPIAHRSRLYCGTVSGFRRFIISPRSANCQVPFVAVCSIATSVCWRGILFAFVKKPTKFLSFDFIDRS